MAAHDGGTGQYGDPEDGGYAQADCACGWEGPKRYGADGWAVAVEDRQQHLAEVEPHDEEDDD